MTIEPVLFFNHPVTWQSLPYTPPEWTTVFDYCRREYGAQPITVVMAQSTFEDLVHLPSSMVKEGEHGPKVYSLWLFDNGKFALINSVSHEPLTIEGDPSIPDKEYWFMGADKKVIAIIYEEDYP